MYIYIDAKLILDVATIELLKYHSIIISQVPSSIAMIENSKKTGSGLRIPAVNNDENINNYY